jgi:hypothetical protein
VSFKFYWQRNCSFRCFIWGHGHDFYNLSTRIYKPLCAYLLKPAVHNAAPSWPVNISLQKFGVFLNRSREPFQMFEYHVLQYFMHSQFALKTNYLCSRIGWFLVDSTEFFKFAFIRYNSQLSQRHLTLLFVEARKELHEKLRSSVKDTKLNLLSLLPVLYRFIALHWHPKIIVSKGHVVDYKPISSVELWISKIRTIWIWNFLTTLNGLIGCKSIALQSWGVLPVNVVLIKRCVIGHVGEGDHTIRKFTWHSF